MYIQEDGKWKWAARHPWQSWRERYKNNQPWFDEQIKEYQKKKGIEPGDPKWNVVVRKKAARRRDAVDQSQSDQEGNHSQQHNSDQERVNENTRKRKRIEERAEGMRKKSKPQEEEKSSREEDATEISGNKRPQKQSVTRRSPPRSEDSGEEDDDESAEPREGPPGSDDYSAEVFGAKDDETIEVSENVVAEEDRDTSQDGTEDGSGEATTSAHGTPNRYVTLDFWVYLRTYSIPRHRKSRPVSPIKNAASPPTDTRTSSLKVPLMHSTPNGDRPLYPDLSPPNPPNNEPQAPGALNLSVKYEPPDQDKLEPGASPQNSHPSQEPTPPLSNTDVWSPRPGMPANANEPLVESQAPAGRKPVFPGGNYRADLPVRTDTLVLPTSASKADTDIADDKNSPKSKLNLKRKRPSAGGGKDSDFFESTPSTPVYNQRTRMAREPPHLVVGPFGSAFTDGRDRAHVSPNESDNLTDESDNAEESGEEDASTRDEKQWPPRRTLIDRTGKGNDGSIALIQASSSKNSAPTVTDPSSHRISPKPQGNHHPFTQPTQEYHDVMAQYFAQNAKPTEASSSKTPHSPVQVRKDRRAFVEALPDPSRLAAGSMHAKVTDSKPKRDYVPSSRIALEASASSPEVPGNLGTSKVPLLQQSSRGSSSDPFLVPEVPRSEHNPTVKDKRDPGIVFDRRQTFGGFGSRAPIPKIDLTLRTKVPHRRIFLSQRQSLPAFSTASDIPSRISAPVGSLSNPSSVSSSPSNMSSVDHGIAVRLGVDAVLQRMSDNHGFTIDVIRRLYEDIGGFQRTDAALRRMRESAEAEAISFISMDTDQVDEDVDTSRRWSPRRIPSRPKGLEYTPAPVDDDNMSDYSPPETSRAGQYARLAREGRRNEALQREKIVVGLGGTGDFLGNIRVSEGNSSGATSDAPVGDTNGRSPDHTSELDHADAIADGIATLPQQETIWGEEEDKLLRSGNPLVLKELEAKMGGPSFKRRTAEINSAAV